MALQGVALEQMWAPRFPWWITTIGGGNSNIVEIFTPVWASDSHFDVHIFQMGWNRRLDHVVSAFWILIFCFELSFKNAQCIYRSRRSRRFRHLCSHHIPSWRSGVFRGACWGRSCGMVSSQSHWEKQATGTHEQWKKGPWLFRV